MTGKRSVAAFAVALSIALLVSVGPAQAQAPPGYDISHCGNTSGRLLLTFDDWGYADPYVATRLGQYLQRRGIRAAFFLIQSEARLYPDIVSTLRQQGHYVLNHTWSHKHLTTLSDADLAYQITHGTALAPFLAGNVLRPPYGEYD